VVERKRDNRMNILRPYKSDLRQIETLVTLGVSQPDIARIIGITYPQLNKWEAKNPKVAELLKIKPRPEYTLNHPEYAPMVEEAFTCAGKRFYRFKEEYRMSTGRYKYYSSTLRELDLKLSLKDLQKFVDTFKAILNGGKKKVIEITDLTVVIYNLESRIKLAFDNETIYKLASIAYFDETEDLVSYSEKYGEEKVRLWKDNNMHDFFLMKPIGELFTLNNISIDSLVEHMKIQEQIVRDLDLNLQKVSEDNL
jgi:hypothetical protein